MVDQAGREATTGRVEIPLFPLREVLLKGGHMQLQIFEPRYLDMVKRCMRDDSGFGVVLIRKGWEARQTESDPQPTVFNIGMLAKIVDFNQTPRGLLGILIRGEAKFRIHGSRETEDHLMLGEVEYLPSERGVAVGGEFSHLVELLRELVKDPVFQNANLDIDFDDASSVSWRLAEFLPLEPEIKQSLLQMHLPRERLAEIKRLLNKLRG